MGCRSSPISRAANAAQRPDQRAANIAQQPQWGAASPDNHQGQPSGPAIRHQA